MVHGGGFWIVIEIEEEMEVEIEVEAKRERERERVTLTLATLPSSTLPWLVWNIVTKSRLASVS